MGGGIGGSGGPCGILVGGIALLGSLLGKETPEEKDDRNLWKLVAAYYRRFQGEVLEGAGSVNCRDITGCDWSDPAQTKAYYKGEGALRCAANAGKAARILGEILEEFRKARP
jgi:C_GCAxxG_C_C family probable redox protein